MKHLKPILWTLTLWTTAGAGLALTGCPDDGLPCAESCDVDDDCAGGLSCLSGTCVPEECADCHDSGRSCRIEGPDDLNLCEFQGCG